MKKLLVVSGLVLVVFIAAISETSAQTIYACYNKKSGAMRYVTGPGKCKKTETQISWNTYDVSRLYTRFFTTYSNPLYAYCNDDDVALACPITECSYQNVYAVQGVYLYEFGWNGEGSVPYEYPDKKPGACILTCLDTVTGLSVEPTDLAVLCIPRN